MNSTLCHSMHCHKSLNITGFYWPATLLWSLYVTKVVKRRHYLTRSFHITGRALSDCHEIWPHSDRLLCWSGGVHLNAASVTYRCLAACCCRSLGGQAGGAESVQWTLVLWSVSWAECLTGANLSEFVASCLLNRPTTVAQRKHH